MSISTLTARRSALSLAAAAALAGFAGSAAAFEIEGPLSEVGPGYIVCNGARIGTNSATQFFSPTAGVAAGNLTGTNFPYAGFGYNGGARDGFKLGTCIATGDDASNIATSVFVEIAENVIVGNTTNAPGQPLAILGVRIVPIEDARMSAGKPAAGLYDANGANNHPAETVRNQFGFGIKLDSVPANDFAAAEGYLANSTEPVLYAHSIETTGGDLVNTTPRPSLQRAQCRNEPAGGRDRMELLGSCVLPTGATSQRLPIFVRDSTGAVRPLKTSSTNDAAATCTADPDSPGYGVWRFNNDRLDLRLSDTNRVDACPSSIGVSMGGITGRYDWAGSDNR